MKAILKQFLASVAAIALLMVPTVVLVPSVANAQIGDNVCQGVLSTTDDVSGDVTAGDCDEEGEESFSALLKRIINIFSIVVGAISVLMIIIGGFRYIISGGDSNGVTAGKNTILYAIVGLVIVLFAQVIVRFVLTNVN